jgi:hypothetical protein
MKIVGTVMRRAERWASLAALVVVACGEAATDAGGAAVQTDPASLEDRVRRDMQPVELTSAARGLASSVLPTISLTRVATIEPPASGHRTPQANAVVIEGDRAYISYNYAGPPYAGAVDIVDISDPERPVLLGALILPETDVNDVDAEGDALYLSVSSARFPFAATAAIEAFPLSPTGAPELDGRKVEALSGFVGTAVVADGDRVFTVSGSEGELAVFDGPQLAYVDGTSVARARDVDADAIWVVALEGAPGALRTFDRATPSVQASYSVAGLTDPEAKATVQVVDGKAVVAAGEAGVQIVSLDDGSVLGSLPVPDAALLGLESSWVVTNAAAARGHDILLAHGAAGVFWARTPVPMFSSGSTRAVDLFELGQLQIEGFASANDIAFDDDHILLAAGREGTIVIHAVETCPAGYELEGIECVDVDGCADSPCHEQADCTDVPAPGQGYTCSECIGVGCPELRALAGPDQLVVRGATSTLTGSADGSNGGFGCAWEDASGALVAETCTATVAVDGISEWTLTVTDASGAQATDAMTTFVAELVVGAGEGQNITSGESATLSVEIFGASCADASCLQCTWTEVTGGAVVGTTCEVQVSPMTTTEYEVEVYDSGLGETASDDTTVFVTDQLTEVCHWTTVAMQIDPPVGPTPSYACINSNTGRRQDGNSDPSVVLSDLDVGNVYLQGWLSVETTNDDDFIGVVWGWQDPRKHYLMRWKQRSQNIDWLLRGCGSAEAGIAVLRVDGPASEPATLTDRGSYLDTDYVVDCAVHWSTERSRSGTLGGSSTILLSPEDPGAFTQGWRDRITYRFDIYYTPTKTKFIIYEDDPADVGPEPIKLTEFVITDTTFPEGGFGFYTFSQPKVYFIDLSMASLSDFRAIPGPTRSIVNGEATTLEGEAELAVPSLRLRVVDGRRVSVDRLLGRGLAGGHHDL